MDPRCFCCTTLRDVIFIKQCFVSVVSTNRALQHAAVCWVAVGGIGAIVLTLG
jgi:hypothetical protein